MAARFTLDDIIVGDSVYFEIPHIPNYDLYWNVISKSDKLLGVEVSEMGANDRIYINAEDVKYIAPRPVN